MFDWQDVLTNPGEVGADFEEKVMSKIRKRKRRRKVGLAAAAVVGIAMLLSLFHLFRPLPRAPLTATADVPTPGKIEVPVSEDLFFSASDSRTRYSLEPVSYSKDEDDGDEAVNQI
ncbi:MAG: hypothetical protein JXO51_06330 [Candidatus Aminicenantes bacterium]|nr:hypothetical protein [Candidatus Aminicenantes bacterium]